MAYQRQEFYDNQTILTAAMLNHIEQGIIDNEGNIQNCVKLNNEGVIKSEQLPTNLLTTEVLTSSIDSALMQAKNSGQFNGKDGITPIRGTHYWTDEDKNEIVKTVMEKIENIPVFGYIDNNNNIVIQGNLTNNSYYVQYQMDDGSTIYIGELVFEEDQIPNIYYTIENNLTHCSNSNSAREIVAGNSYSATISANSGYELKSVVVRMGGTDISASAVSGGSINIANVTGNIVITAVAEEIVVAPTYTNLANPTSEDWKVGYRLNSSAEAANTSGIVEGMFVTNFIPVNAGDVVRIKGADLKTNAYCRCAPFKADKTVHGTYGVDKLENFNGSAASEVTVGETYAEFTSPKSDIKYWRFTGILNGSAEDVVITVNEKIV